ncbi:hypothetical protein GGS26DRAFT_584906 [Hypomontagnella submonticulosa]|nr:hypothetical protein GGS26DRAFT_584906 [Hypomontagnella submonticulosa]
MSFGFSVGDFIAGANLAHKLIRVMTETRGASAEYQEALAEVCGIQQIFIQLTQLCRSEVLPRATLNSLAQIIMPSMITIADFLDRTKHYQAKLAPGGGLSSSWCKMGWALFRKEELKLLRDTLHSRLSAINTLLAAANHFPSMPESVAQYQVKDEDQEDDTVYPKYLGATSPGDVELEEKISALYESTPTSITLPMDHEVANIKQKTKELLHPPTSPLRREKSQPKIPLQSLQTTTLRSTMPLRVPRAPVKQQYSAGEFETYFQTLIESAINIQAEAEAKAAAERKAAEEAEWRKKLEEAIRLETEFKIRTHMENKSKALEEERLAQEQLKKADEAKMNLLLKEAEEEKRKERKPPLKFKDAVGRKFTFPFEACNTWQGIEELIKQAFLHVDVIGPHVQQGHYDLIGPSGEIILPQMWDKVVEPDWSVTMHMWPMDRKPQRANFPAPPPLPPPIESESDDEKMFSLRSYLGNKMKRLRKRVTHKSDSDSIHSSTSSAISL